MNRVIVNSKGLLEQLKAIDKIGFASVTIKASAKNKLLEFEEVQLNCECQNDFKMLFYKSKWIALIKHLELISEQPITLQFSDSETFAVKICEMYV